MEQQLIKLLDNSLECTNCKIKNKQIILAIQSVKEKLSCPYCGYPSSRVHSAYEREIQDIPFQDKQTILLLATRKMFCDNTECTSKTFSERFDFVNPKGRKTNRLMEKILVTSTKLSSVSASSLLNTGSVKVCKSSICDLLKKNANTCG
ncbi:transposase family protein [Lacrimispora sp.]|uniref:transposase family protein n=1 Tax=Lacrimispora sp. TaxID=2719234 RepID=UPI0032E38275